MVRFVSTEGNEMSASQFLDALLILGGAGIVGWIIIFLNVK